MRFTALSFAFIIFWVTVDVTNKMPKRLNAHSRILCAALPILAVLAPEPAMAWRGLAECTVRSYPTKIDLDTVGTLIKASAPIDKREFEHVADILFKKIKNSFSMSYESTLKYRTTPPLDSPGALAMFDDAGIYRTYDLKGNFLGPMGTNWIAPLNADEIESCTDLLSKLGPGSFISADPVIVSFSAGIGGQRQRAIHIEFCRKGFLRAYYTIATPLPSRSGPKVGESPKSLIAAPASKKTTKTIQTAYTASNGTTTIVKLGAAQAADAKFNSIRLQLLKLAAVQQLTPVRARELLNELRWLESDIKPGFRPFWHGHASAWQPAVCQDMREALKKVFPIVTADLTPSVKLVGNDASIMLDLDAVYYDHGLLPEWAKLREWSIKHSIAQTDQSASDFNTSLYDLMSRYLRDSRITEGKDVYRRACEFIIGSIRHLQTDKAMGALQSDARLESLARICELQME